MEIIVGVKEGRIDKGQVENIIKKLKQKYSYVQFKLKEIDENSVSAQRRNMPADTQEEWIEDLLIKGKIDILIQDMRTFNTRISHKVAVNSIICREDARDVYILPWPYKCIQELPMDAKIVASTKRSYLQLKNIRDDIQISIMQGSILQELKNMDTGKLDGLILTAPEAKANAVMDRISGYFSTSEMVPAPCEGVWGLETHRYHYIINQIVASLNDTKTSDASYIERQLCKVIMQEGGLPLGAYCNIEGEHIWISAAIYDETKEKSRQLELCAPIGCEEELIAHLSKKLLQY